MFLIKTFTKKKKKKKKKDLWVWMTQGSHQVSAWEFRVFVLSFIVPIALCTDPPLWWFRWHRRGSAGKHPGLSTCLFITEREVTVTAVTYSVNLTCSLAGLPEETLSLTELSEGSCPLHVQLLSRMFGHRCVLNIICWW